MREFLNQSQSVLKEWQRTSDHSRLKTLSYDTRNVKRNFNPSFAVPLTASVPTNGGSPRTPVETEESNKLKYIVGISASVFVVFAIVVALCCFLRRRCNEGTVVNDPTGT